VAELDHARAVLAAIIPDRLDLLIEAMRRLEVDHFRTDSTKVLWRLLVRFYDTSGGVLPPRPMADLLSKIETSKAIMLEELYKSVYRATLTDEEFRYSMGELVRLRKEQLTADAITTGMELLTRGGEIDGKEVEPGADAAWEYMQTEYARITSLGMQDSAPEGDVFSEPAESLKDYAERKEALHSTVGGGVSSGIEPVDKVMGGAQPGELILVCGYTTAGKSMLVTQWAHSASMRKRNVFFATSETTRAMTRRRLIARHSRLPQFNIPGGLDSKDIKLGKLTPAHEQIFKEVVHDLDNGVQTGLYGKLYVAQIPRGATLSYVEATARRVSSYFPVDLVVIDYLALIRSDAKRDSEVAEFSRLLKDSKVFATTFDSGRGVPVISPWAMNQQRYRQATTDREYTLASLSDTSEAEKSPDVLLSLLRFDDSPGKLTVQFLKNRDGDTPPKFDVQVDYRSTYIGEASESVSVGALMGTKFGDLDA
jgi:replicative DNA helicase